MAHVNHTVLKTLDLLNLFAEHPSLSLQNICDLTQIPKGSAHRLLASLQAAKLLQRNAEGEYMLGYAFLHFGHLVSQRLNIRQLALPAMHELLGATGEAVSLVLQDGSEAVYVERLESTRPVRTYTRIGRRAPLHAGACPRAILGFLPDEEISAYILNVPLVPFGRGTITDAEALWKQITHDRLAGFTVSHSELEDDTAGVGAPVYRADGSVAASLSLSGPESRFQPQRIPALAEHTLRAAHTLSTQLGASPFVASQPSSVSLASTQLAGPAL